MTETERNQQIAERIIHDFRWNAKQFAFGDWIALLDGEIVAVTDSAAAALAKLRSADPDPKRGMLFRVQSPVLDVIRWGTKWRLSTFPVSIAAMWLSWRFYLSNS